MRFFNPLFFVIAIALLIGASAWAILSQNEASAIRSPSLKTSLGVQNVSFVAPQRQEFGFYFGNKNDSWRNRDPFVPFRGQKFVAVLDEDPVMSQQKEQTIAVWERLPAIPPGKIQEPPLPPRFPVFPSELFAMPQVIGMLKLGSERVGTIRLGKAILQVREGESVNTHWKLIRLDSLRAILQSSLGQKIEVPVGLSAEKIVTISQPPTA